MRSPPLIAIIAIFTASTTTHASVISLDVTTATVSHTFSPGATVDYILGPFFGAAAVPSFTANLSQVNTFSLTASAPAG